MFNRRIRMNGLVVVVTVSGIAAIPIQAQHHDDHRQSDSKEQHKEPVLPNCPVMGEPIDFAVMEKTDDGPVYFCCKMCIKDYRAKPEKFAKKVAAQREALAALPKVQVTCPITGRPVDQKAVYEKDGDKTYFCCKMCLSKFTQDPGKYKEKLADCFTYQTKCPVMGEEIDPKVSTTLYNGLKLYYCCARCDKKFRENPAKYVANLEAQGIKIDPKKVGSKQKEGDKDAHESDDHEGHDHDHEGHDH